MNDKQRDYLMTTIQNTHRKEVDSLRAKKRSKPSLNNYLVAAFLDNSIKFNDIEKLRGKIRNHVIKMGAKNALIHSSDNWRDEGKELDEFVKVPAADLFILPEAYVTELKIWEKENREIDKQIQLLEAQLKTIEIKIRLGSNAVLDKLILEADNLGEISLINTRLQLALTQ